MSKETIQPICLPITPKLNSVDTFELNSLEAEQGAKSKVPIIFLLIFQKKIYKEMLLKL